MTPEIRAILESTDCVSIQTHHGHRNGIQVIIRFRNGYGASVINCDMSKGVELAVVKFFGPHEDDWDLCYDTPVTSDVIPYLTPESLAQALQEIVDLPAHPMGDMVFLSNTPTN